MSYRCHESSEKQDSISDSLLKATEENTTQQLLSRIIIIVKNNAHQILLIEHTKS